MNRRTKNAGTQRLKRVRVMKHSLLTVYGRWIGKKAVYDGPERRTGVDRRESRDRRSGTLLTRDPDRFGRRSGKDRRVSS